MPSLASLRRALPAALFLLLTAAASVQAQVQPTASLAAEPASLALDPGATGAATITVTSTSTLGGTVALAVTGAPAGWAADVSPASVPAGQAQTATLTVRAPAARPTTNDGATPAFALTVTGTATDPAGQTSAPATVQVQVAMTPAPLPPPPEFPWLLALGGLGLALAGAVGGAAWWRVHRRESGITLTVPAEAPNVWPGMEAVVALEVANVSDRPRLAEVETVDVPRGWAVGTNNPRFELEPGERRTVWLAVKPALDTARGDVTLRLGAKPAEGRRGPRLHDLPVRVTARPAEVPAAPAGGAPPPPS